MIDTTSQPFTKFDIAKYLNAWDGFPHLVCSGNEKNFAHLMENFEDRFFRDFDSASAWPSAFIAKAIIFREVQSITREAKIPAYQANVTAYTVSLLARKTRGRVDFGSIVTNQGIGSGLRTMLQKWVKLVDRALLKTASSRMPTEWAKKEACWLAMRKIELPFPAAVRRELKAS